jgi:hypothetical protein
MTGATNAKQNPQPNPKDTPPPGAGDVPGAGEGAGSGDSGKPAAGESGSDGENGAKSLYRPDGLPDHLVGANDQETIDKLFKTVDGFRKEQTKKGIPETPDGYTMSLPEEIKGKVFSLDKDGKDPIFEHFKPIFHELNLSDAAANKLITELYTKVSEIAPPAGEGDESVDFDFKELGGVEKAKPTIDATLAALNGLKARDVLDDADVAELSLSTAHAGGLKALRKLIEATGEKIIPANIGAVDRADGLTEDSLNSMMKDERYWKAGKKDPAYIAEVTKKFQDFYGED